MWVLVSFLHLQLFAPFLLLRDREPRVSFVVLLLSSLLLLWW
jgi:hypothetical protein